MAAKLAAATGCALLLLIALAWSAQRGMSTLARAQREVSASAAMERQMQGALIAAQELRVLGRVIAEAQTTREITRALDAAKKAEDTARARLHSVTAGAGQSDTAAASIAALEAFGKTLAEEADKRTALLNVRGGQLLDARAMFTSSANSFADELAKGGVSVGGVDAVTGQTKEVVPPDVLTATKADFAAYQTAMDQMQNTALLFLATGNRGAANEVKDDASSADAKIASLLSSKLPGSTKSDVKVLATLGQSIAQAAEAVVDQTIALDDFLASPLEAASLTMADRVTTAADQLATAADVANHNAAQAEETARRQVPLITAGIVAVLLFSSCLTVRAISRPVRDMTRAIQSIAGGDTDITVGYAGRSDEIGRMAAALEALRGVVREAFVKAEVIRQFPTGMLTAQADDALTVTYVNPEAQRLLGRVAQELPVPPDAITGQSVLMLYPDREGARAILRDPTRLPNRTRVTMGDETFDVLASAINDRAGAYVGPMLTLHRVTEQMKLVQRFEQDVGRIAQIVSDRANAVQASATAMSDTAEDAGRRTEAVAAGSEQAAGNIGSVAASAEELAASVAEIGRRVSDSARIANEAVEQAGAADQCMGGLSEAAARIGDVVRLISDIAGRTNLLALNATIEAARAGEAGKGFAVVASEVKTLATQTARATEEISAQIHSMQAATNQSVEALRSIGATIRQMSEIAVAIAGATEEQGAATQEIARAVQEAAARSSEVTSTVGQVADLVADTSHRAVETLGAATELTNQSAMLRTQVDRFLTDVRQAA